MKFRWEKKYLYWGVTALLVVIGGLLAYYLIFHGGNFKDHLQNLLHICMPILDGFILAWLMCPLVNAIEHFALYPARDWLISQKPSLQKKKKQLTSYCRGISIVLTLCFVLFLVYGFFRVVIPQIIGSIQSIAGQFPSYVKNVSDWAEKLLADNPDIETTVSDLIDHYSTDLENFLNKTMMPQINAIVKTVSLSMLSFAKAVWNLVIGLIISIYLLASKERFVSQGKKLLYAFWDTRQANVIMEDFRLIDSTETGKHYHRDSQKEQRDLWRIYQRKNFGFSHHRCSLLCCCQHHENAISNADQRHSRRYQHYSVLWSVYRSRTLCIAYFNGQSDAMPVFYHLHLDFAAV